MWDASERGARRMEAVIIREGGHDALGVRAGNETHRSQDVDTLSNLLNAAEVRKV